MYMFEKYILSNEKKEQKRKEKNKKNMKDMKDIRSRKCDLYRNEARVSMSMHVSIFRISVSRDISNIYASVVPLPLRFSPGTRAFEIIPVAGPLSPSPSVKTREFISRFAIHPRRTPIAVKIRGKEP